MGLTGSGLVLTDDGGDAIALSPGATSFTFPTAIPSGSAYDVEVETQPSGPTQQCTPTANTGVVGGANVTNVVIDCSVSSFSVSGTVNGLSGSGLYLSDGAGSTIDVSGSAFSFVLPSGTAYAVTVASQPVSPWETCTVTSGVSAGTITNVDVTGIVFTCTPNSYTVSGTVTGLAGKGLELSDGAGNVFTVAGTTFSEALPSGTAYSFTAYANPINAWQTCTATTGGSGTVTDANISGIVVTCTTNSYPVVVSITGADSDFDVCDNGTCEELGNGSYSFPAVLSGQTYTVSHFDPPPHQTCSYTEGNETGTIEGSAVTVEIYCAPPTYNLIVNITQACDNPVTLGDGTNTLGPIAYGTNSDYEEFPALTVGTSYSMTATWAGGCICYYGSTNIVDASAYASGVVASPGASFTVSCQEEIQ